ncbi:uncharacterized protein PV09_00610 [Verruconis gallopava]|uniref:Uncharacterized protein n=1 Tax=Verruconis gallopava TaxID=253628 RepID=A0A0D2AQ68_9PEZI|nr:uncharacterized protein PV09_00610 [Verruconis gallopava]KIW08655.1 hypothetical protein PV09_00610 [Verruconis gallopava]
MSVERAVNGLIVDIDQLTRLYLQLCDVPAAVQHLVHLLADVRSRLIIASRLLGKTAIEDLPKHELLSGNAFTAFRSRLLDFELFLDPEQFLHHSGAGSHNQRSVPWDACEHGDVHDFCMHFKEHILQLDSDAAALISFLNARVRLTPEADDVEQHNSDSPSLSSLRSFALGNSRTSSPSTAPSHHGRKKRSPRTKTEEELIFDRFVQQYSKLGPVGKRRRPGDGDELSLVSLDALSRQLPFPFPAGQADLERLQQQIRGSSNFDNADVPEWNLDDLRNALPPSGNASPGSGTTATSTSRQRGKQRASAAMSQSTLHLTEYGLTEYNSSSSGSIRSMPTREGSIFSVSSRDRMYEDGACKLWHRQGTQSLTKIDIARTEIRRDVQHANGRHGFGVIIVSTTPLGHEIQDSLWIPTEGVNSSPFLEHVEVVHTFQRRDPTVNFVVRFVPNTSKHPQYSFTNREDCWDFMQAITEKVLCASLDIETVKSAATHASAVEAGTETIQIWEDQLSSKRTLKLFRNKNEHARQRVVELDVGLLRQPHKERRTQKLVVELRDSGDPLARELRYLKIVFSNPDAEEGFMHECGFRKNSVTSVSTAGTDRFSTIGSSYGM